MTDSIKLSVLVKATPQQVYEMWMSSAGHADLTGSKAVVDPKVGGKFTAWDDYISGETVSLEPFKRIVQKWRTTEFGEEDPDSEVEVLLAEEVTGTRVTLVHTGLPPGSAEQYREGWKEFYVKPLKRYFTGKKE